MPLLSTVPSGTVIFVDANIFLEHLVSAEPSSTSFFHRLRERELEGETSTTVLAEVRHRLMLIEATRQGYVKQARRALETVRDNPQILAKLGPCDVVLNTLLEVPLRIIDVTSSQFRRAQILSIRHHLLTNDALHLAAMESRGLKHLASADKDFRHIQTITVWHL